MKTKAQIRKEIRQKRSLFNSQQQAFAATQCFKNILTSKLLNNAQNIAVYLSNDHELDLNELWQYCLASQINCYLPVLDGDKLNFIAYDLTTKLKLNKYKIAEPVYAHENQQISAKQLDLVFMPLVAFTKEGKRLGMGKGYYDRTFAFLSNSFDNKLIPKLIGVAYDLQEVEFIPDEEWDVKLHGIVTESRYLHVK